MVIRPPSLTSSLLTALLVGAISALCPTHASAGSPQTTVPAAQTATPLADQTSQTGSTAAASTSVADQNAAQPDDDRLASPTELEVFTAS